VVELFRERLESYDGRLHEAASLEEARAIARDLVGEASVTRWADTVLDAIARREAPAEDADVSLVLADLGVAQTGAIALVHGAGRPRAAGLLPTRQVALLAHTDLVETMAAALARLYAGPAAPPANAVFVAGPSRTSDIEQRSIRGVHAPRDLDVVIYR